MPDETNRKPAQQAKNGKMYSDVGRWPAWRRGERVDTVDPSTASESTGSDEKKQGQRQAVKAL